MKYQVLGLDADSKRFNLEVIAACPREAEIFVSLRSMCQDSSMRVCGVFDVSRRELRCSDLPEPELQNFSAMLEELRDVLLAGRICLEASSELRWLCEQIGEAKIDPDFFRYCESRLIIADSEHCNVSASRAVSDRLIRLAAIGMGLVETGAVPKTQNLVDLMFQVRATAILYNPILATGFCRPSLRLVRSTQ